MGVSFISKTALAKEEKIEITLKVVLCVLILAVTIAIAVVGCVNLKNKSRLRQIQEGTFFGELNVSGENEDLPKKRKVKVVVDAITREEYLQSDGIGTTKDIIAGDLGKNKYYSFKLFLEENSGEYEQIVLGKIDYDRHRGFYHYGDKNYYIKIEPYTVNKKGFVITIITKTEGMIGDVFKGE